MTELSEQGKQNLRELFSSLVQSYELLCEYSYVESEGAKSEIRGVLQEIMRLCPSAPLKVNHDCCYHDYDGDNRCAICGNIIDYDLE